MWMNFKEHSRDEDSIARSPVRKEFTRQASKSSKKSNTSTSNLQKKIEEYCFKTNTEEWKKEQEYKERRRKKKLMKKQVQNERTMKYARVLNLCSVSSILCGIVLTLGSCIRSVSEGTFFWEYREITRIVGPIVLVVGIVLLMVAVAVNGYIRKKLDLDDKTTVQPFVHPDFLKERQSISRESSSGISCELDDSYRPLIRRDNGRLNRKWYEWSHFNSTITSDDSFISSSSASNTTSQESQTSAYSQQWANAVTIRIPEECVSEFEVGDCSGDVDSIEIDHVTADKDNTGDVKDICIVLPGGVPGTVISNINHSRSVDCEDIVEKQYLEGCIKESINDKTLNGENGDL